MNEQMYRVVLTGELVSGFQREQVMAALAKELGGDQLQIYSATTSQQDPHHIQARPSLIAKARKADLLICTGAELEVGWLPLLLRRRCWQIRLRYQRAVAMPAIRSGFLRQPY